MGLIGLIILLLAGTSNGAADDIRVETSYVEARTVPQVLLDVQDDAAFRDVRQSAAQPNPLQQFLLWLERNVLEPLFRNVPTQLAQILLYLFLAVVLGFAIYQIFRGERPSAVARKVASDLERALADEGIEGVDLEAWLERALAEGRHRDAVRLHYLIALQVLAERGEITWAPEKTNSAYVRELRGGALRDLFSSFTRMFDYVWYGSVTTGPADVASAERYAARVRDALQPVRA